MSYSRNTENIEQTFRERDHAEALLIDHFYNELRGGRIKDVAKAAIDMADCRLENPYSSEYAANPELQYPNAESHGYETVKGAYRWFNYRGALLQDIKNRDEHRAVHLREQMESGELLIGGDPVLIAAFKSLDTTRIENEKIGRPLKYPLYEEKQQVGQLLLNTLDTALRTPPLRPVPTGLPENKAKNGIAYDGQDNYSYELDRTELPVWGLLYIIKAEKQAEQFEYLGIERITDVMLAIGDTPTGLTFKGRYGGGELAGEDEPDIISLARLARMLSPDGQFTAERAHFES